MTPATGLYSLYKLEFFKSKPDIIKKMNQNKEPSLNHQAFIGIAFAVPAFLIWGLSPIFWKTLKTVPAFEILMHRMIWSFVFLLPLISFRKQWKQFFATIRNFQTLSVLSATTLLVALNWFVFIYAINHDQVLQASLGYYINPLINVLLGILFLKERLRPLQGVAVVLAGIGVVYLTVYYGQFPYMALILAFSFGFYGLLHKITSAGALLGLSIETLMLSVPAAAYLIYIGINGNGAFLNINIKTDFLLAATALVTGLPLLLFTMGAKRIQLSTVGFLQYIAPSCTFLLAVFIFKEPLLRSQVITFIMIWTALAIYSADSFLFHKNMSAKKSNVISDGESGEKSIDKNYSPVEE